MVKEVCAILCTEQSFTILVEPSVFEAMYHCSCTVYVTLINIIVMCVCVLHFLEM